ncbi:DUF5343 domain-containing protein [Brevundimonas sp.]|uniref:DUF5343 domain-containing protein n=1 Tax=Brevundimonas sp. TaxID=1871086 RepID=UPI002FDB3D3D
MDATSPGATAGQTVEANGGESTKSATAKAPAQRREIPGNLVYTSTPGSLRSVLDAIIKAEIPEKVTQDFISTVLGLKGGSAAQQLPVLKRLGFVSAEGTPTDRYRRFRSDTNRSVAALEALKAGYASIFQKNTYAHKLPEADVRDLAAEITGLRKTDSVIGYIYGNFDRLRGYIIDKDASTDAQPVSDNASSANESNVPQLAGGMAPPLGLNYVINLVLPHSNSIETYNLIFKSLRENIIDWNR